MSALKKKNCGFCNYAEDDDVVKICEKLWQAPSCAAHWKCMKYSSRLTQYRFPQFGGFLIQEVEQEIKRGKRQKCSICKKPGATAGCAVSDCSKLYHFICAERDHDVVTNVIPQNDIYLYRVFCCEDHKQKYLSQGIKKDVLSASSRDSRNRFSQDRSEITDSNNSKLSLHTEANGVNVKTSNVQSADVKSSSVNDRNGVTVRTTDNNNVLSHCHMSDVESDSSDASESLLSPRHEPYVDLSQLVNNGGALLSTHLSAPPSPASVDLSQLVSDADALLSTPVNIDVDGDINFDNQNTMITQKPTINVTNMLVTDSHSKLSQAEPKDVNNLRKRTLSTDSPSACHSGQPTSDVNAKIVKKSKQDINSGEDEKLAGQAAVNCEDRILKSDNHIKHKDAQRSNDLRRKRRVCTLCIPVCTGVLQQESCDCLLLFAVNQLRVSYEDVYLLVPSDQHLTLLDVLHNLCCLSAELRPGNEKKLAKRIFTAEYHRTQHGDVERSQENALRQRIQNNFQEAASLCGKDTCGFYWIDTLKLYAGFIVFNDTNDKSYAIRSHMSAGAHVYTCPSYVKFSQTHNVYSAVPASAPEHEFNNLCSWIKSSVNCQNTYSFPEEHLLCVDDNRSVCERLRQHFAYNRLRCGEDRLVFVRPTAFRAVAHCALLQRIVHHVQNELLTARHNVFIVTDVGERVGLSFLDIKSHIESDAVKPTVYSGVRPLFHPISCVIISLSLCPFRTQSLSG